MNFLNRAWKYVTRRLSKSILLGVTFFMIGNLVLIGLGISAAANNAKILTRQSMRAVVNYEVDNDKFWQYMDSLESDEDRDAAKKDSPKIDKEIAMKLGQDERVKAMNFSATTPMYSEGFDNVLLGNEKDDTDSDDNSSGDVSMLDYKDPNIMIVGGITTNTIEFVEETNKVIDGRMYNQEDLDNANKVAVITKELADLNGLSVGDTIKVSTIQAGQEAIIEVMGIKLESTKLELEIIGIYTTKADVDPNDQRFSWMSPYESPKNYVLIPGTALGNFNYQSAKESYDYYVSQGQADYFDEEPTPENQFNATKVVYLLNDPLQVDDFVSDYKTELADYTILNANNEQFNKLAKPLDTLSFFANVIVWIVALNAVVIISLVTTLTLKTREFEIGVLLSLGVSKIKVVMQLFVELVIIAVIGFTLAVGSGTLIAGQVGKIVLDYQQSSAEEDVDTSNSYYWDTNQDYFTEITQDDVLSKYNVTISIWIIMQIYIMGMGVVFISIVIPSAMIMRLNPKQILLG